MPSTRDAVAGSFVLPGLFRCVVVIREQIVLVGGHEGDGAFGEALEYVASFLLDLKCQKIGNYCNLILRSKIWNYPALRLAICISLVIDWFRYVSDYNMYTSWPFEIQIQWSIFQIIYKDNWSKKAP